jgi:hypothetical protein
MTFNSSAKVETRKVPIMEDDINGQFKQLQSLFLDFSKIYDDLIQYEQKLPSMNKKEFDAFRDEK